MKSFCSLFLPVLLKTIFISGGEIPGLASVTIDGNNDPDRSSLLDELTTHVTKSEETSFKEVELSNAIRDYNPQDINKGSLAWNFLKGLSVSQTFVNKYWHSKPLLLRSHEISEIGRGNSQECTSENIKNNQWVDGSFTLKHHLRLLDNSWIAGSRTDDILRNGTKTDTWAFLPIKDDPSRRTTWEDVSNALDGGTIYFNSAGSLWPSLGALCRLTSLAFGLPTNVNVYVTPPGAAVSVPPHTDRQDVIVFQTEGSKRWRVYRPSKRELGKDPLNRGKAGDVLAFESLGTPLLDIILRRGDVMYVPAGYPHTTDTCTILTDETTPLTTNDNNNEFDETSVHLTMGLDTHVWALTFAHLRWTLLQRCGKQWRIEIKDDDIYWKFMETIPVGFLGGDDAQSKALGKLKEAMVQLEPHRWQEEDFPSDDDIIQVIEFMAEHHLTGLLDIQNDMFSNIDPHEEETILKAYKCTQKQNAIMEHYGKFSKNEGMRNAFEKRRLDREEKTKGSTL